MKRFLTSILTAGVALALAACSAGVAAPASGASAEQSSSLAAAQTTAVSSGDVVASTPASSAAAANAENSPTHAAADDYLYDASTVVSIRLNGDSISTDGDGVTVAGSTATITSSGTYILSGSLADGQIRVSTTSEGTVQLVLNGVQLSSSSSAPIAVMEAQKTVLLLADGTQNTVTDGSSYVFESAEVDEPNAAIFSKSDLSISGGGSLTVNGNYQDGIVSKDGLIIAGGNLTVQAVDDGIRGKDYLVVEGGTLTVDAQGDGLKSDNEEDATRGYISITDGTLQVNAGGDAIHAQTDVSISAGTFTLTSGGGSANRVDETSSAKGIKGTVGVNIDGGTFTIDTADDAIHSNGSITINGGVFNLASADDGAHADQTLTVNGGEIRVTQSYEGLESSVITINDGTLHIAASDDGINVAGGNDGSGMNAGMRPGGRPQGGGGPQMGGGPGQDAFTYTGNQYLYVHGGYVYVDAQGDGLDVNGAIEMTAGVVLVNGPTEQMNGALDYDGGFTLTGGFLVAAGSSGMALAPGQSASQASTLIFLPAAQAGGTLVHIQNSAGEDILTFAPTRQYQSIAFTSPELAQGQTYTIFTGGSSSGGVVDGLYEGGTYTPGTEYTSFTTSDAVTTVGTGGGGGGRMGGPRR